jgi:hypothetical protein
LIDVSSTFFNISSIFELFFLDTFVDCSSILIDFFTDYFRRLSTFSADFVHLSRRLSAPTYRLSPNSFAYFLSGLLVRGFWSTYFVSPFGRIFGRYLVQVYVEFWAEVLPASCRFRVIFCLYQPVLVQLSGQFFGHSGADFISVFGQFMVIIGSVQFCGSLGSDLSVLF